MARLALILHARLEAHFAGCATPLTIALCGRHDSYWTEVGVRAHNAIANGRAIAHVVADHTSDPAALARSLHGQMYDAWYTANVLNRPATASELAEAKDLPSRPEIGERPFNPYL